MAPIPSTLDDETNALIDNLQRREKDLSEFQIPRLRECKGPLSVQQRLGAELREDLEVFGKEVEVLEIRAEDVPRKTERLAVLQLVEEFREASERIRKDMRAALLHSKKVIDAQAKSNREKLFLGAGVADSRNVEEKATDDALMKASNDVTDALRRTIGLMQSELERSVLSHQMLEQSTAALRVTSTQHDLLSSATHASKQLITALERADWLDRLLVLAALTFFFLVVLFILKQRVLDKGVRLAFWWTRYLSVPGVGSKVGGFGDLEKGGVSVSASVSVVSAVKTGTQVVKDAVSTALVQASSVVSNTAGSASDSITDASSSLLTAAESGSSTLLDSLCSFTTSETIGSTTTTLDALSETLSTIQHSEL